MRICEICGRLFSARRFCVFCEIRGRTLRSHQTIFPQNSRNTQKRLAEKKNLCASVKSVGEYPPLETSVNSVNSVGGLTQTNLEWVLRKEFGGQRGYGIPAIPTQPQNYLPTEFTDHTETTGGEEKSVNSVKSVGGSSTPEASVGSACSVGDSYLKLCWCSGDRCTPWCYCKPFTSSIGKPEP